MHSQREGIIDLLKESTQEQITAFINHPFNQEIRSGKLNQAIFKKFLEQDLFYLQEFSKIIKQIAGRLPLNGLANLFMQASHEAQKEAEKTQKILNLPSSHGLFSQQISTRPHAITDYVAHLRSHANNSRIEVAIASILPCFILFSEHSIMIQNHTPLASSHPYHDWISSFCSQEFNQQVVLIANALEDLTKELSMDIDIKEKMKHSFQQSIAFEIKFIDEIYKFEENNLNLKLKNK